MVLHIQIIWCNKVTGVITPLYLSTSVDNRFHMFILVNVLLLFYYLNPCGVLLAVKSNISCSRRPDLEEDICELLWAEIPLKNSGSYFLGVFYRPPSSDMNYLEGLKRSLEKVTVVSDHTNIVLLGDFNFPDIDWDLICPSQPNVLSDYFCDNIVNFYGFSQLIDEPARQDAILDRYSCDI